MQSVKSKEQSAKSKEQRAKSSSDNLSTKHATRRSFFPSCSVMILNPHGNVKRAFSITLSRESRFLRRVSSMAIYRRLVRRRGHLPFLLAAVLLSGCHCTFLYNRMLSSCFLMHINIAFLFSLFPCPRFLATLAYGVHACVHT